MRFLQRVRLSYTYDGFNRLATASCTATAPVTCPDGSSTLGFSYSYDQFGNLWTRTVTAGTAGMWSDTFSGNRVAQYTYDAAGNVYNNGTDVFSYDDENRIEEVQTTGGSTVATYVYNALGERVEKTTSSTSVYYVYDLAGRVVAVLNSTGGWERGEVYAGGMHVATYVNNKTYFTNSDSLGSARVQTDSSGALAATCQNLPYGQQTNCSDVSPMGFTGKQYDSETGLNDFGARYYASSLGRFMTPDWSATAEPVPYAKLDNPQTLGLNAIAAVVSHRPHARGAEPPYRYRTPLNFAESRIASTTARAVTLAAFTRLTIRLSASRGFFRRRSARPVAST